jgi:hypothetical protein
MLEEFLHTWESIDNGCIKAVVYGEKITLTNLALVMNEWLIQQTHWSRKPKLLSRI